LQDLYEKTLIRAKIKTLNPPATNPSPLPAPRGAFWQTIEEADDVSNKLFLFYSKVKIKILTMIKAT
jgi:hypothetical protein